MKEDGIDPLSPAFKALTRDVLPDLQRFGDELYDILGEQAFLEYEHNIRALSWEYGHSMNSAMAAVRGLGNEFDVLKKKSTAAAGRQGRLSAYRDSEAISEAVRRQRQREIIGFRGDSINITGYDAKGNFITRTFRSRIMAPSKTTFGGFSGELVRQFSAGVGIDKLAGLGRRLAGGHESRSTGNQVGPTRAGLTRATGRRHRGGHHPDPLGWFTALARIASPHGSVQGVVGAHGWAAMSQNLDLAAQVGVDLMEAVRRAAYSWNLNFNRGGGNNIAPALFRAGRPRCRGRGEPPPVPHKPPFPAGRRSQPRRLAPVHRPYEASERRQRPLAPGQLFHDRPDFELWAEHAFQPYHDALNALLEWRKKIEGMLDISFGEQAKIERIEGQGRFDLVNMLNRHERLSMAALGA